MRLLHYAATPLTAIHDVPQPDSSMKPVGLWVSVDDAWAQWCRREEFGPDRLETVTEVKLAHGARVWHVSDPLQIESRYGENHPRIDMFVVVNWARMSEDWDGVILTEYGRRPMPSHATWYYSWDCASGCIWRARAVGRISPAVQR